MAYIGVGRRVRIKEQGGSSPPPEKNVRGRTGVIQREEGSFGGGSTKPTTTPVQIYEVVLDDDHSNHYIGADWLEPL